MITTSDIADILYEACASFGVDVFRKGYIPEGEVTKERVVIIPKEQTPETYWRKAFVEVNMCVPDISDGVADLVRLAEMERQARLALDGKTGEHDGSYYLFSIDSISGANKDDSMRCHYVNVRLLFQVLNTMEI